MIFAIEVIVIMLCLDLSPVSAITVPCPNLYLGETSVFYKMGLRVFSQDATGSEMESENYVISHIWDPSLDARYLVGAYRVSLRRSALHSSLLGLGGSLRPFL